MDKNIDTLPMTENTILHTLRSNYKIPFHSLIIAMLLFGNCKPKEHSAASTGLPTQPDSTLSLPEEDAAPLPKVNNIIQYAGATDSEIKIALQTFSPFTPIHSLAHQAIEIKDSLEMLRGTQQLTDPNDSLIFRPYEIKAYQAILAYKERMTSGPVLKDYCPSILKLDRSAEPNDSSSMVLPKVEASAFLSHGNFFFLGGAPFIYKLQTDNNTIYTDPQGNAETRFGSSTTENGNFLLSSFYHFKNVPINITFGPPLDSYDSGPQEVNGIGSLIHTFVNRIPVFFLTEDGLVPAHLISVTLKVVPENMGCVSDQPRIDFACSKNLGENEILGVYIPYNSPPITSCITTRPNNFLWTADLNGDGIPELACVSGTFEGISSDTMAESLWFININGTWQILDWAEDLDCT